METLRRSKRSSSIVKSIKAAASSILGGGTSKTNKDNAIGDRIKDLNRDKRSINTKYDDLFQRFSTGNIDLSKSEDNKRHSASPSLLRYQETANKIMSPLKTTPSNSSRKSNVNSGSKSKSANKTKEIATDDQSLISGTPKTSNSNRSTRASRSAKKTPAKGNASDLNVTDTSTPNGTTTKRIRTRQSNSKSKIESKNLISEPNTTLLEHKVTSKKNTSNQILSNISTPNQDSLKRNLQLSSKKNSNKRSKSTNASVESMEVDGDFLERTTNGTDNNKSLFIELTDTSEFEGLVTIDDDNNSDAASTQSSIMGVPVMDLQSTLANISKTSRNSKVNTSTKSNPKGTIKQTNRNATTSKADENQISVIGPNDNDHLQIARNGQPSARFRQLVFDYEARQYLADINYQKNRLKQFFQDLIENNLNRELAYQRISSQFGIIPDPSIMEPIIRFDSVDLMPQFDFYHRSTNSPFDTTESLKHVDKEMLDLCKAIYELIYHSYDQAGHYEHS